MSSSIYHRSLDEDILSDEEQLIGTRVLFPFHPAGFIIEKPDSDIDIPGEAQELSEDEEEYDEEVEESEGEGEEGEEDLPTLDEANAEREIEGDFEQVLSSLVLSMKTNNNFPVV